MVPQNLSLIFYPDPRLRVKSSPVAESELDGLAPFLKEFRQTLIDWEGFGLAAPQVGLHKCIIAVDRDWSSDEPDIVVLFNPVIHRAAGKQLSMEGCLSVPFLQAEVDRYEYVEIKARGPNWEEITLDVMGYEAACFQHEIEHLNGILLVDHLSRLKRDVYERKLRKLRKKGKI